LEVWARISVVDFPHAASEMQSRCGTDVPKDYPGGNAMKKFSLAMVAMAIALVFTQAATAQNYDFTFNGGSITASGELYAPGTFGVTPGNATSGNIIVSGDPNLTGTGTLFANPNGPGVEALSPSGFFVYDDTLYPGQDPSIDNGGLLFIDNGNFLEINIYSNGSGAQYTLYDNTGFNTGGSGTFTLTYVPEYGSLSMLILCAFGLAGVFLFKARQSGLFLNR
jgi:hypothetical protein